jgi:hypothetical protein
MEPEEETRSLKGLVWRNWRCETLKVLPELTLNSLGKAEFLKDSGMTRSQTSWKLISSNSYKEVL